MQLIIQKLGILSSKRILTSKDICQEDRICQSEAISKFIMLAVKNWGNEIIDILGYHLSYVLPFLADEQLPFIASHVVQGFLDKRGMWESYIKSYHFKDATRLHPHVILHICSVLMNLTNNVSGKRKLSEMEQCEDEVHDPSQNLCVKLFKKLSKKFTLISDFEQVKSDESELWESINECGELYAMIMDCNHNVMKSFSKKDEVLKIVRLIGNLPVSCLDKATQAVLMIINLTILVKEIQSDNLELKLEIMHCLNALISSSCHFKFFTVVKNFNVVEWILKERFKLPNEGTVNPILLDNLTRITKNTSLTSAFDKLFHAMAIKYVLSDSSGEKTRSLGQFITTSGQYTNNTNICNVSVIVVLICRKFMSRPTVLGRACRAVVRQIGAWMLRFFRTLLDLSILDKSTKSSILLIYTVLLEVYRMNHEAKKKTDKSAGEETNMDQTQMNDSLNETIVLAEEESVDSTKIHKWQKLINIGVKLADNSLIDLDLKPFALEFLMTC